MQQGGARRDAAGREAERPQPRSRSPACARTWFSLRMRTSFMRLCRLPLITYPRLSNFSISVASIPTSPRRGMRLPDCTYAASASPSPGSSAPPYEMCPAGSAASGFGPTHSSSSSEPAPASPARGTFFSRQNACAHNSSTSAAESAPAPRGSARASPPFPLPLRRRSRPSSRDLSESLSDSLPLPSDRGEGGARPGAPPPPLPPAAVPPGVAAGGATSAAAPTTSLLPPAPPLASAALAAAAGRAASAASAALAPSRPAAASACAPCAPPARADLALPLPAPRSPSRVLSFCRAVSLSSLSSFSLFLASFSCAAPALSSPCALSSLPPSSTEPSPPRLLRLCRFAPLLRSRSRLLGLRALRLSAERALALLRPLRSLRLRFLLPLPRRAALRRLSRRAPEDEEEPESESESEPLSDDESELLSDEESELLSDEEGDGAAFRPPFPLLPPAAAAFAASASAAAVAASSSARGGPGPSPAALAARAGDGERLRVQMACSPSLRSRSRCAWRPSIQAWNSGVPGGGPPPPPPRPPP